jgi:hypothetical protein
MLTLAQYIKLDPTVEGPFVIIKMQGYSLSTLHEVCGKDGLQHGGWYVTFNGNSKQRRQQQRKLIRDLNQEK